VTDPKAADAGRGPEAVAVGADHAGYQLKEAVSAWLRERGIPVEDLGAYSPDSCDYPDVAFKLAEAVGAGRIRRGVLVCGAGIGMSIAANKVRGVRAALCTCREAARLSRTHNDANVLVLPGRDAAGEDPMGVLETWLDTPFSGEERHRRRLDKIARYEEGCGKRD
jgi:ribose 5-phosphate isomerase B